jgi:hypothetical protein
MESQLKCPHCGSVIYSRRIPVCGRCGEKLPESLLFDSSTRKKVEQVIEGDKKRAEWERKFPGPSTDSSSSM